MIEAQVQKRDARRDGFVNATAKVMKAELGREAG